MGKAKRDRKKEREAKELEKAQAAARVAKRRRAFMGLLLAIPVLSAAAALGAYYGLDDRRAAGLLGLIGASLFIATLLGYIGSNVTPRDRSRAGAIDFGGQRRRR